MHDFIEMPHFGLVGGPCTDETCIKFANKYKTQKKVTFNTGEYVAYKVGLPGSFPSIRCRIFSLYN